MDLVEERGGRRGHYILRLYDSILPTRRRARKTSEERELNKI